MPARLLPDAEIEMHPPEPFPVVVIKPVAVPVSVSLTIDEIVRDGMRLPYTCHGFRHMMAKLLALQKAINVELPGMIEGCPPRDKAKGTQQEVMSFCISLGLPSSDGEWFFLKAEGCGWRNNGKKIVDWQATCRAWKIGNYFPSQKQRGVVNGSTALAPRTPAQKDLDAELNRIRKGK